MNEGSQVDGQVLESCVGVVKPSLEPLRARRELAFGHIGIGHRLQGSCKKCPDNDLEADQRFGELQAPERKDPFGESL
jgi:hypothetical protein